ncbi:hypothetical protein B7486_57960 [cyanobacterium TDX16]|nr:hypothetical protein B7486_57960 [cyanobacterium TDX16]
MSLEEAEAKGALASVAGQVIVAVDASKLGQRAAARCLPVERIDVLVTELDPKDERLAPFRDVAEVL